MIRIFFLTIGLVYASISFAGVYTLGPSGTSSLTRNININATINRTISCGLSVDNNNKSYQLTADQVFNYGDFFEKGLNILTYQDVLTKIPNFNESVQAFTFTMTCNYPSPIENPSKTYRLKLSPQASILYTNMSSTGFYRYLLLPPGSRLKGGAGGFVMVVDSGIGILSSEDLISGSGGFSFDFGSSKTCNVNSASIPMGATGYCSMVFHVAPVFVAADTDLDPVVDPLGKNSVYAPKAWINKSSYQISFDATLEFF